MNQILKAIECAQTILIVGHIRPDGDSLGSTFALREYCLQLGKLVDVASPSPIPEAYSFIKDSQILNEISQKSYDLFIAVDCASRERIGKLDGYFCSAKETACIDHHSGHYGFAKYNLVESEASSTCELIFDLINGKCTTTRDMATYLYMGLSSDTGHFMHSNTNSRVFEIALSLVRAGADFFNVSTMLYRTRSLNKTRLIARAIDSMSFYLDGRVAIITLTEQILSDCGVSSNETEGIIDYAIAVEGVEIGVCICEEKQNDFKASFRSRGRDVNEIAGIFGGGGHICAAGCRISGKKEDIYDRIIKAVKDTE